MPKFMLGVGAICIVAVVVVLLATREDSSHGVPAGLLAATDPLRGATTSTDSESEVPQSSIDPESILRLRASIENALREAGVDGEPAATDTVLQYTLGLADDDIDRLAGMALNVGAKPNSILSKQFRSMLVGVPDRLRPRDLDTWNDLQVLRFSRRFSPHAAWLEIGFDDISASRPATEEELASLFELNAAPGVFRTLAPSLFPLKDLATKAQNGEVAALVVAIPVVHTNGDRSIFEIIIAEYEPGSWYPLGAMITQRKSVEPAGRERAPRPH